MHYVADDLGAVGGRESHLQLASGGHHKVRGLVLVRVRMPTDDDGLLPAGDEARDVLADDGLAEDGASQNVADGAVGRPPHELELELLHALLVRSDRRTLDAHVVLLDGLRAVHGHLVVRLVTVLHAQVVPSNGGVGALERRGGTQIETATYVCNSMSRKGRMSLSLIASQIMRVISSPRISTTGPALIFCAILHV